MRRAPWRVALRVALFAAGLAVVVWLVSRFPLSEIGNACRALGLRVLLLPVLALGWYAASTTALWYLLQGAVPWSALLWNRLVGEAYNSLLPLGGVGGEPFKLAQLVRYVDRYRAVVALVNDRFLENFASLLISGVFVGAGAVTLDIGSATRVTMLAYSGGAILGGLALGLIVGMRLPDRVGGRLTRGRIGPGSTQVGMQSLALALTFTLLSRAVVQLEVAVLFWLLGLPVTPWTVLFTGAALSAAGFVGGVIPQGMGVAEAATVGVFGLLNFPVPLAVAFALARRGRMLVIALFGITLDMVERATRKHRRARRRSGESNGAEHPPFEVAPRTAPSPPTSSSEPGSPDVVSCGD